MNKKTLNNQKMLKLYSKDSSRQEAHSTLFGSSEVTSNGQDSIIFCIILAY